MASTDDMIRILWVSDIHYREYPAAIQPLAEEYIRKFVQKVREIELQGHIDYILFSGDIAFDGSARNYECFTSQILDPLINSVFDTTALPKVITIPGNHDLSWDGSKVLLEKYLAACGKEGFNRNNFLEGNQKSFRVLFEQYTKAFTEKLTEGQKEWFDLSGYSAPKVENEYSKTRLFGHVLDKEKGILFVLLNSAWYSLGTMFEKTLIDVLRATTYWEANIFEKIPEYRDAVREYGGQIIGRALLANVDLSDLMKKYSDLTVILCMHHPMHWLEWGEVYSEGDGNMLHLTRMLKNADVLLTGHEHLPANTSVGMVAENTLHFMAGKFLPDNLVEGKEFFSNNRFSILDIVRKYVKPSIQETRYIYSNGSWQKYGVGEKLPLRRKTKRFRSAEMNEHIRRFDIVHYIKKEILHWADEHENDIEAIPSPGSQLIKAFSARINQVDRVFISSLESPKDLFTGFGIQPEQLYLLIGRVPDFCTLYLIGLQI